MSRVISHFVLVCFNGAFIYLFSSKGLPFLLYLIFLNNFVDTDVFIWNESLENSVWTFCTYCYKYHVYILRLLHCYLNFRCLTAKDKNNQRAIKKYFYVCFYFDNVCVDILSCFLSSIILHHGAKIKLSHQDTKGTRIHDWIYCIANIQRISFGIAPMRMILYALPGALYTVMRF